MSEVSFEEKCTAALLLGALGDSLGYKRGAFEFERDGTAIMNEVERLGGLSSIDTAHWIVSDDTVMHLATARAIVRTGATKDLNALMEAMAEEYVDCMRDMGGRAPGNSCIRGAAFLRRHSWTEVAYRKGAGGCGGSMRAMCLGLAYSGIENREFLIAASLESGRMTHNFATGWIGSVVSALFAAYALEGVPIEEWGSKWMNEDYPRMLSYVNECDRDLDEIAIDLEHNYYRDEEKPGPRLKWTRFLSERSLDSEEGNALPTYDDDFLSDVAVRDQYWITYAFYRTAGSSGDDSCIISYDCILAGGDDYETMVKLSCWHGGDSDSTGIIAMAWWGILYGMKDVFEINIRNLEKRREIEQLGRELCRVVQERDQS